MSGVGIEAYWVSTFVWDFVSYLVPMSSALILYKAVGVNSFFDNGADAAMVLLFLLFGLSMVRECALAEVCSSTYPEFALVDPNQPTAEAACLFRLVLEWTLRCLLRPISQSV